MRRNFLDSALNADILTDVLSSLHRGGSTKTDLILDNLRVHDSKPVKAWLAKHKPELGGFGLPSGSPERDPETNNCQRRHQASCHDASPCLSRLSRVNATAHQLRGVQRPAARLRCHVQPAAVWPAA